MTQNLYILSAYVSIRHWRERKVIGFRDPDLYTRLMLSYFLSKKKEEARKMLEMSVLRESLKFTKHQFGTLRAKIDEGEISLIDAETQALKLETTAEAILTELEKYAES